MLMGEDDEHNVSEVELVLFQVVLLHPGVDYKEVVSLELVAKNEPKSTRSYVHERAVSLAQNSGCEHGDEPHMWNYDKRARVTTCCYYTPRKYQRWTWRYERHFAQWARILNANGVVFLWKRNSKLLFLTLQQPLQCRTCSSLSPALVCMWFIKRL